jgi:hypothetical protein
MNEVILVVMFLYIMAGALTIGLWYIYNWQVNLYRGLNQNMDSFIQRLKDIGINNNLGEIDEACKYIDPEVVNYVPSNKFEIMFDKYISQLRHKRVK